MPPTVSDEQVGDELPGVVPAAQGPAAAPPARDLSGAAVDVEEKEEALEEARNEESSEDAEHPTLRDSAAGEDGLEEKIKVDLIKDATDHAESHSAAGEDGQEEKIDEELSKDAERETQRDQDHAAGEDGLEEGKNESLSKDSEFPTQRVPAADEDELVEGNNEALSKDSESPTQLDPVADEDEQEEGHKEQLSKEPEHSTQRDSAAGENELDEGNETLNKDADRPTQHEQDKVNHKVKGSAAENQNGWSTADTEGSTSAMTREAVLENELQRAKAAVAPVKDKIETVVEEGKPEKAAVAPAKDKSETVVEEEKQEKTVDAPKQDQVEAVLEEQQQEPKAAVTPKQDHEETVMEEEKQEEAAAAPKQDQDEAVLEEQQQEQKAAVTPNQDQVKTMLEEEKQEKAAAAPKQDQVETVLEEKKQEKSVVAPKQDQGEAVLKDEEQRKASAPAAPKQDLDEAELEKEQQEKATSTKQDRFETSATSFTTASHGTETVQETSDEGTGQQAVSPEGGFDEVQDTDIEAAKASLKAPEDIEHSATEAHAVPSAGEASEDDAKRKQEKEDLEWARLLQEEEEKLLERSLQEQREREEEIRKRLQDRPLRRYIPKFSERMKNLFAKTEGESEGKDSPLPDRMEKLHSDPNVYRIKNFVTEGELLQMDAALELNQSKFNNSKSFTETEGGERILNGDRTSCSLHMAKFGNRTIRDIEHRAADLVGMPVENVEPLQVVRYLPGQYYKLHHDCGAISDNGDVVDKECDDQVRMITIFVYLTTLEEGCGGETVFPMLGNLKVRPVRGSAVVFCNVLQDGQLDSRAVHQAMPPKGEGIKYGMNIWISSRSMMAYSLLKNDKSGVVMDRAKTVEFIARMREKHKMEQAAATACEHEGEADADDGEDEADKAAEEKEEQSKARKRKKTSRDRGGTTKRKHKHKKGKGKKHTGVSDSESSSSSGPSSRKKSKKTSKTLIKRPASKTKAKTKAKSKAQAKKSLSSSSRKAPKPKKRKLTDEEKYQALLKIKEEERIRFAAASKKAVASRKRNAIQKQIKAREEATQELNRLTFSNLYPWIREEKGWGCKVGFGLYTWVYFPPTTEVKNGRPQGSNGIDWFGSNEDLVHHIKHTTGLLDEYREFVQRRVAQEFPLPGENLGNGDDDHDRNENGDSTMQEESSKEEEDEREDSDDKK
ncbi:Probable prolyl 4-hydroxylase 7 (AtP4H7) [Durusdinium trenchii]|uniref:Probable prolyl 4-hydroxylase 7 (AtP4H7) n=1 Tax=Durusdinium trenchii TaxID=1381693 RepID=A0ABP0JS28_9DINO